MSRRRWLLLVLGLIVVTLIGLSRILPRSIDDNTVEAVTVAQLWRSADAFEGKHVRTVGVVRIFSPGPNEYFVIEQAGQYRMGLRGLSNADWEPLAGQTVTVKGVVHFKKDFGYYIEVEHVEPAATGTPASS